MTTRDILFQGNMEVLSSFSHVNHYLTSGLRSLGYHVVDCPADAREPVKLPLVRPDIYMFHGHPYDCTAAPGLRNVFFINYEYFRVKKKDEIVFTRINRYFDLLVVASSFVRDVLSPYVRIPIEVVPWGVDPACYHPARPPAKLSTHKSFIFIYAGAVYARKGTDLLVQAYLEEFSAGDDVCLVVKEGLRMPHFTPWIEQVLGDLGRTADAPEVLHIHEETDDLSGYFTAADVGVFPFRGEGFGLPLLECVACGTPVIATAGTGPLDFLNADNADLVPARRKTTRGEHHLEPDIMSLRQAMRRAYQSGSRRGDRERVAKSVGQFTWDNTLKVLQKVVERRCSVVNSPPASVASDGYPVAYGYYRRGVTSWQKCAAQIDQALRRHYINYTPVSFSDPLPDRDCALVVGQSDYCCELFLRSRERRPDGLRVLHQERSLLEARENISDAERRRCGVPPVPRRPMHDWRHRMEHELADRILVPSRVAADALQRYGYAGARIKVIPWGMRIRRKLPPVHRGPVTFLFVGTDPYRKGIRLLLEAWDQLSLRNARLICFAERSVLQSHKILSYLVKHPDIEMNPILTHRRFLAMYDRVDCQILPSLEDSFSLVIADGMGAGKPAIVTEQTGIADLITHGQDGYIVPSGSVEALKEAILYCYDHPERLREMGEAAYATAKRYSWSRFRDEFLTWLDTLRE